MRTQSKAVREKKVIALPTPPAPSFTCPEADCKREFFGTSAVGFSSHLRSLHSYTPHDARVEIVKQRSPGALAAPASLAVDLINPALMALSIGKALPHVDHAEPKPKPENDPMVMLLACIALLRSELREIQLEIGTRQALEQLADIKAAQVTILQHAHDQLAESGAYTLPPISGD